MSMRKRKGGRINFANLSEIDKEAVLALRAWKRRYRAVFLKGGCPCAGSES